MPGSPILAASAGAGVSAQRSRQKAATRRGRAVRKAIPVGLRRAPSLPFAGVVTLAPVNVFDHDSALLDGLSRDEAEAARLHGRVQAYDFPGGSIDFTPLPVGLGYLVLRGFIAREATVVGRTSVEVLGPGDLLRPWEDERAEAPVPVTAKHRAIDHVEIGLLGPDFTELIARWPAVIDTICSRVMARARWLAMQTALAHLPRIEDRLLVLLWHLADRWGRVERDGTIVCPIPLTHAVIAGAVGSRRPTVTTALSRLAASGHVTKHPDGWGLHGEPPTAAQIEGHSLAEAFRVRED